MGVLVGSVLESSPRAVLVSAWALSMKSTITFPLTHLVPPDMILIADAVAVNHPRLSPMDFRKAGHILSSVRLISDLG